LVGIFMHSDKAHLSFGKVLFIILIFCRSAYGAFTDLLLIPGSITEEVYLVDGQDSLRLWIHTPLTWSEQNDLSVILFFHGGGGDPEQFIHQAEHFCGRGMVAIRVLHRLQAGYGLDNKGFLDGMSAVRWVREHADVLGIDSNRIVLSGGSAGGGVSLGCFHYEGWYTHASDDTTIDCEPNLLILFNPAVSMFLDEPFNRAQHPASIFFQGSDDTVTPPETLREYINVSQEKTMNHLDLVVYRGRGHGFFNYNSNNNEDYENTLARADTFLVDHGYIPAMTALPDDMGILAASAPVLFPNFPNPFNGMTTIRYSLSRRGTVRICIVNSLGQTTHKIIEKHHEAGQYTRQVSFNGMASGIYILTLFLDNRISKSQKMVLIT